MSTWLDLAERSPLRFSQVREDPRLDLELIEELPAGASAIMIASGGDTAALVRSRSGLRRLHLVDANPAQLALTRLKLELQGSKIPRYYALSILGHREMDPVERSREVRRLLGVLKIDPAIFGPSEVVGEFGPDHIGRYEHLFAELRRQLHQSESDPALRRWLNETLSGEAATRNPRLTFARHFADQTRQSLRRFAPAGNPFLWQIFAGRFPDDALYDWINWAVSKGSDATPGRDVFFHEGMMREVLDDLAPGPFDFVHLSNILDWLTPEEATRTLTATARVLRPGGIAIIRQLNSSLDIRNLPGGLEWDAARSASFLERDRSFFYRAIANAGWREVIEAPASIYGCGFDANDASEWRVNTAEI